MTDPYPIVVSIWQKESTQYESTYLTTFQISNLPYDLNKLTHLQVRIRLQEERDIAIIATCDCRLVAAESGHCTQDADGVC